MMQYSNVATSIRSASLIAAVVWLFVSSSARAQTAPPESIPPWDRVLTNEGQARAAELNVRLGRAQLDDDYPAAVESAAALLQLRRREQGADHWETVSSRWDAQALRRVAALSEEQRREARESVLLIVQAGELEQQRKFVEAQPLRQRRLDWSRRVLGSEHPHTAADALHLAVNLSGQRLHKEAMPLFESALAGLEKSVGREHPLTASAHQAIGLDQESQGEYAATERHFRAALEICAATLGPRHIDTARCANDLAMVLQALARYEEATPLLREALDTHRRKLGEDHRDTAQCYSNLGVNLAYLGQSSEAASLEQRALELRLRILGDDHPDTAQSYDRLGSHLNNLGKSAEAVTLHRKGLAIRLRVLGDEHPDTATSYDNLAVALNAQHHFAEATPLFFRALSIRQRILGGNHPDTGQSCNNLAANLSDRGEYEAAGKLLRTAWEITRRRLGEDHPSTITAYRNLAFNLNAQNKFAEAAPMYERVLELGRRAWGDDHPETARGYFDAAENLSDQGLYANAVPLLEAALAIRRRTLGRFHPETGLVCHALAFAWAAQTDFERATPFLRQAIDAYEVARLRVGGRGLERATFGAWRSPYALAAVAAARAGDTLEAWQALEADLARGLLDEESEFADATDLSEAEIEQRTALTRQLDNLQPKLIELIAAGEDDAGRQGKLERMLAERNFAEDKLAELAASVSRRRVAPFELVQAALPADGAFLGWVDIVGDNGGFQEHWGCVVRPSGPPTWIRLTRAEGEVDTANELASLIDRVREERLAPLMPHLEGVRRLYVAAVRQVAGVPIELLTDQHVVSYVLSGTHLARMRQRQRPVAPATLLAIGDPVYELMGANDRGQTAQVSPDGGPAWRDLPGTKVELSRLAALFEQSGTTILSDSDASEQRLQLLQESGALLKFRYLHIAAHGQANDSLAFESALILSQDQLPTAQELTEGAANVDGRLTAGEILGNWKLESDLVTLSACGSGRGSEGGGDGVLGFAQALLLAGSRSVCLSLWDVDDTATVLLMDRFYQNLLGKREGLAKPLPKAEALSEAKDWLRNLTHDEVKAHSFHATREVARGAGRKALPLLPRLEATHAESKPYADPVHWAAFILIGDPD
jgi:CHAT domain-containing protein/tetratricopeptide (TPR) repeat protein